jgi:hypothetical protein
MTSERRHPYGTCDRCGHEGELEVLTQRLGSNHIGNELRRCVDRGAYEARQNAQRTD